MAEPHKNFFLALRIGAEILLSQRGKRLERKPDPKGNANLKIHIFKIDNIKAKL